MSGVDGTERKAELLERFRQYLEDADDEALEDDGDKREVDLYALFLELAALKSEVRIESRQVKEALDLFRGSLASVQAGHAAFAAEGAKREREVLRPLLLELVDLRDRMVDGLAALRHKLPLKERLFGANMRFRSAVAEGHEMTLRRLDGLLAARGVRPIETMGRPLDPASMRAGGISSSKDVGHGIVTGELATGYRWEDEILRPAEVVVNKRSSEGHG